VVLALAVLGAGCIWRSDAEKAAVHAEVLVAQARKGRDLVVRSRFSAESMAELTYPLERARVFAQEARPRRGRPAPPWLAPFDELVARYRDFVDVLDRVRREHRGRAAREALAGPLRAVKTAARAVRSALAAGPRR
jgi:hypothetical protein